MRTAPEREAERGNQSPSSKNWRRGARPNDETATPAFQKDEVIRDYRLAFQSRQASLIGRKEVLSGKAKFGIFGDGKEVPQLAMARAFRKGDFRSGYYRDQTFMFATGMSNLSEFFAQLYANTDLSADPASGGRQMNGHFATRTLNDDGSWKNLADIYNCSADVSPTGSQMPRLVGLAYASKLFREVEVLKGFTRFSHGGNEVAWGTIGNASCAEGMFWESLNALGVVQAPVVMSVWDDGYGISVPNELQITKGNISEVLRGFQRKPGERSGFEIFVVKAWDYAALCETYEKAAALARAEHVPTLVHVVEVTQPQGHSTSGSHERYKSKERLKWEEEFDCLRRMRQWMVAQGYATDVELDRWEEEDKALVRDVQLKAWEDYRHPIDDEVKEALALMDEVAAHTRSAAAVRKERDALAAALNPFRRDIVRAVSGALIAARADESEARTRLAVWRRKQVALGDERYGADLYSTSPRAALRAPRIPAVYGESATSLNGFEVINACFDAALKRVPELFIMGEDVGRLGDVNQGCAGLQEKHGALRVSDTGIRECTILGQAIGAAMRGLRPIAEIQYLDYILYALQIMSDDLATVRWRTRAGQAAPVIVRTRGHRLEGVWHSGSPMAGIIHLVRGMHVCVPRNMVQAAGMYNTLLQSDDPAVVVEVLNGYRMKEKLPQNVGEFTVPLGEPEVLREGSDVTLVTYGACCRLALEAAELLQESGISVEVVDVQTLLPFDVKGRIVESLKKTNRILFVDEDVPGGTTGFMMQQVLEVQGGWQWLDSPPRTLAAKEHRPAYGSDGDYWSKPNRETIFEAVWDLMNESDPARFPSFF
ncbi:MAG: thiamine pyrophosphate-dependent enzyme [Myxococcota bacterium]